MLNVFNLSFTDAFRHYKENRAGDLLRVDFIACELPLDSSVNSFGRRSDA
jgi:hypothetical protein